MANEPVRVVLHLEKDTRLVAGVGAAVARMAEHAGFDAQSQANLTAAVEEASRELLLLLAGAGARLCVRIESFSDRFEVALESPGRVVPARDRFNHLPFSTVVDRVAYDTQGDTFRMTLVKYLRAPSPPK